MNPLEAIILSVFLSSMLVFFVTAIAATFCIDPKKSGRANSPVLNMGNLFVSEKILTTKGMRIARVRNYSLLTWGLTGVALGVYLNLLK